MLSEDSKASKEVLCFENYHGPGSMLERKYSEQGMDRKEKKKKPEFLLLRDEKKNWKWNIYILSI